MSGHAIVNSPSLAASSDLFPEQHTSTVRPALIVVMGVSGCGKSTIAARLATTFGVEFVDGDNLHTQSNIEKMAQGIPLQDDDRWPWLSIVREEAARKTSRSSVRCPGQRRRAIIIGCSALKKSYRDLLRGSTGGQFPAMERAQEDIETFFIYLKGLRELLMSRLTGREDHFFGAKMLDSQLAALEEPRSDEDETAGLAIIDVDADEKEVCERAVEAVRRMVKLQPVV